MGQMVTNAQEMSGHALDNIGELGRAQALV